MGNDDVLALAAVKRFISSLSKATSTSSEVNDSIIESSFCVLSYPNEIVTTTMAGYATRKQNLVAKYLRDGARSVTESFTTPAPEIWVYDDIAAVFIVYAVLVDGKEVSRTANYFGLLRLSSGWRISGLAEAQWTLGDAFPPLLKEPIPDVGAKVDSFLDALENHDWEAMVSGTLYGGGITLSRAQGHSELTWSALIERLRGIIVNPEQADIVEKLHDVELRAIGNIAFAWTPFVIINHGKTVAKGVNIMTLLKRDDGWIISGLQDTNRPI